MTDIAERKKTIGRFYQLHGNAGLEKLSKATGAKVSYLRQIMYSADKPRPKIPSLPIAFALVEASGGLISYAGLLKPLPVDPAPAAAGDASAPAA